ncbi:MAG: hypothetical protein VYE51_00270 [Candidatus Thermoplasmatota archaeon]|nr:hypothetical protein [Candidatus Thermoplasmatota archaeon]
MLDTIFCLGFVLLVLFWLIGRGISTSENHHSNIGDYTTPIHNDSPALSMDPADLDDPANMAMWMELGEL